MWRYTTRRVLVSEWVDGRSPSQLLAAAEAPAAEGEEREARRQARRRVLSLVRMGVQCSLAQVGTGWLRGVLVATARGPACCWAAAAMQPAGAGWGGAKGLASVVLTLLQGSGWGVIRVLACLKGSHSHAVFAASQQPSAGQHWQPRMSRASCPVAPMACDLPHSPWLPTHVHPTSPPLLGHTAAAGDRRDARRSAQRQPASAQGASVVCCQLDLSSARLASLRLLGAGSHNFASAEPHMLAG